MKQTPSREHLYVIAVTAAAVVVLALIWHSFPVTITAQQGLLLLSLGGLIVLAHLHPLSLSPRMQTTLVTAPTVMTIFLLPPPLAVTTALLSFAVGEALLKAQADRFAFNVSRVALCTAAATVLTAQSCPGCSSFEGVPLRTMLAIALAVGVYHLVDLPLTAAMAALTAQKLPIGDWWQQSHADLLYQIALALLGVAAAIAVAAHPWALAFIAAAAIVLQFMLHHAVQVSLQMRTCETVEKLADIIDQRDLFSQGHSRRVAELARRIALYLGIDAREAENIYRAARVHDFGKIGVPVRLLQKPGPLSEEEKRELQTHVEIGAKLVGSLPEFHPGRNYLLHERERWDGSGYPLGLQGEQIPLGARIIAVADAFDAMTSDRPYRPALPLGQVLEELRQNRYVQWDGAVVDALLAVIAEKRPDQLEYGGSLNGGSLSSR